MHAFLDEELSRFIVSGSITNFSGSSSRILLKLLTSSICSSCNYHHHYSSMNLVCSLDLSCTDGYRRVGERRSVPKSFPAGGRTRLPDYFFRTSGARLRVSVSILSLERLSPPAYWRPEWKLFVQFYTNEPGYISHDFIPFWHFFRIR